MRDSKSRISDQAQKEQVRKIFTEKADSYAAHKPLLDQISYEWMLKLSRVGPRDRVLDVATGPGFIALLLAERARYVIGLDLTRALLRRAEALKRARGLSNMGFLEGDVESLPFPAGAFDLVACHKAFHHFPRPQRVLKEIHRVLKEGGRLVLGDTLSSEDPQKSRWHNRLERMRDSSHVKMYPLTELRAMIEQADFQIEDVAEFEDERDFETWMKTISPPPAVREEIRRVLLESLPEDRTGQKVRLVEGRLYYTRHSAVIAAVK